MEEYSGGAQVMVTTVEDEIVSTSLLLVLVLNNTMHAQKGHPFEYVRIRCVCAN